MRWRYRAWTADGQAKTGEVEAVTRQLARERLRGQGLMIEELRPSAGQLSSLQKLLHPRISLRQLALFCSQVAMLLEGGVPLLQALQAMSAMVRAPFGKVLTRVAEAVEQGQPLSKALSRERGVFPRLVIQIVGTAELSGMVPEALSLLGKQFEREHQIRRKVRGALIYPTIVLTMAFGLMIFMLGWVVPQYAGMFRDLGAELPWVTRSLMVLADFVRAHVVWILGLAAGLFWLPRAAARRSQAVRLHLHRLVLRIPVIGALIRMREVSRYCRSLATSLKAGVAVLTAAEASADVLENDAIALPLQQVPGKMQQGESLTVALRSAGVLPPLLLELLAVGELVGHTDETLFRIADVSEGDVNESVDQLMATMEPVLVIFLGGIILMTLIPLLLPMFDIYTKIV